MEIAKEITLKCLVYKEELHVLWLIYIELT